MIWIIKTFLPVLYADILPIILKKNVLPVPWGEIVMYSVVPIADTR
jgi:hypothetical protein